MYLSAIATTLFFAVFALPLPESSKSSNFGIGLDLGILGGGIDVSKDGIRASVDGPLGTGLGITFPSGRSDRERDASERDRKEIGEQRDKDDVTRDRKDREQREKDDQAAKERKDREQREKDDQAAKERKDREQREKDDQAAKERKDREQDTVRKSSSSISSSSADDAIIKVNFPKIISINGN